MAYWAYENWRANGHRATVHDGACGFCNEGAGTGRGGEGRNGRWLGPCETAEQAVALGASTGATVLRCGHCTP